MTYAIGIFMLNQFIAFLTPKIDPAMRDYEGVYLYDDYCGKKAEQP